jgi:small GTP-binding protein
MLIPKMGPFGPMGTAHWAVRIRIPSSALNGRQIFMVLYEFKIVIIGAVAVGKTAIAARLHQGIFDEEYQPTIGAGYISHRMTVEGNEVELQIWDTAGMERYRSLGPIYYRDAVAAIIVYAQNDPISAEAVNKWYEAFHGTVPGNAVIAIAANKVDLECTVPAEPIELWARENHFEFFRTSATTGLGVNELFTTVVTRLLDSQVVARSQAPLARADESPGGLTSCC